MDDISKVFCKSGYDSHVHSFVLVSADLLGQKFQLVLYPL
jgi:hypothetical protein